MRRAAALATLCVTTALIPPLAKPHTRRRAVPVDIETSDKSDWYILQCYVGNEVWCAATIEEILGKPEHVEQIERKIMSIRNKSSKDIRSELSKEGIQVSGKSNRLLKDIYFYSKVCNINIRHEA